MSETGPARLDPVPSAGSASLGRATVTMSALTAVSRLTGFARIMVVAAVLGTTPLGNTYQSANTVPNLLFELFAAGALGAVLVPGLVDLFDRGAEHEAEHVAGSVLGLLGAGLGAVAAIGMVASPLLARGLFGAVEDPALRADQIELGTVFLVLFLPQIVCYAAGLVATGVLHARQRFAVPAIAPAVNNLIVIGAYLLFDALRGEDGPSLDLSALEVAVLGGGTTLAVLVFTSLPVFAAHRSGFSLRPRFDHRHPGVRRLARQGAWAGGYVALTQLLLLPVLVLGNRIADGGVVAYQVAFAIFLLPHALFSVPILTTRFPGLARAAIAGDDAGWCTGVRNGVTAIAFFALPATVALVVLAQPIARLVLFGDAVGGVDLVAAACAGFGPGLLGYGLFLLLTRAAYAQSDMARPTLVNAVVTVSGTVAMVVGFSALDGPARVAGLSLAHSAAYTAGAVLLGVLLTGRGPLVDWRAVGVLLVATVAAAAVMAGVSAALPSSSRGDALVVVVCAGGLGVLTFVAGAAVLARRDPRSFLRGLA